MQKRPPFIEVLGDLVVIAFGAVCLYVFGSIWVTGGYMAVEPNSWILWFEIVMGIAFVCIGINRFIDDIRG